MFLKILCSLTLFSKCKACRVSLWSWRCSLCRSQRKRIVSWRLRTPCDWAGRGPALWPCAPTGFVGCLSACSKSFNRPQKHRSVKWKAEVNWKSIGKKGRSAVCQGGLRGRMKSAPGWGLLLSWDSSSPAYTLGTVGEERVTTRGPDSALQNQESWNTQASPKENSSSEIIP